jgi:hypothetical protein
MTNGPAGRDEKHGGRGIRVVGWLSLVGTVGWFLIPFTGATEFSTEWGVVFLILVCTPLIIAAIHLGRASALSDADRERWSNGLFRFGPFVAWLYLITKHKAGG